MTHTLCTLAIAYGKNKIDEKELRLLLADVPKVTRIKDGDDFYYEGDHENTMVAVDSLAGDELTFDQVTEFIEILRTVERPYVPVEGPTAQELRRDRYLGD